MKKLFFNVDIKAPKEKVWDVLWNQYDAWTKAFSETSHAITDNWKESSKVKFVDASGGGMVSTVTKNVPNELMSFEHHGEIKNGEEMPLDEKSKEWAGAMENYHLKEQNGITSLSVDVDIAESHESMFNEMFPKALGNVKSLSEK